MLGGIGIRGELHHILVRTADDRLDILEREGGCRTLQDHHIVESRGPDQGAQHVDIECRACRLAGADHIGGVATNQRLNGFDGSSGADAGQKLDRICTIGANDCFHRCCRHRTSGRELDGIDIFAADDGLNTLKQGRIGKAADGAQLDVIIAAGANQGFDQGDGCGAAAGLVDLHNIAGGNRRTDNLLNHRHIDGVAVRGAGGRHRDRVVLRGADQRFHHRHEHRPHAGGRNQGRAAGDGGRSPFFNRDHIDAVAADQRIDISDGDGGVGIAQDQCVAPARAAGKHLDALHHQRHAAGAQVGGARLEAIGDDIVAGATDQRFQERDPHRVPAIAQADDVGLAAIAQNILEIDDRRCLAVRRSDAGQQITGAIADDCLKQADHSGGADRVG